MKLKYITFTLENCDRVTVDGKYVGAFIVGDIKTDIYRIACNSIRKMVSANEIVIEIHKNANKTHYALGQKECGYTVFETLTSCNDITSIEFELEEQYVEDGRIPKFEHYDYFVNWTGDNDYENDSQKSYISKPGHLYLVINRDKGIEDYFDKEEIDDSEIVNFTFNMCDVGDVENESQYDSKGFTSMLNGKSVEQIIEEYSIILNKMNRIIDKLNEIPN